MYLQRCLRSSRLETTWSAFAAPPDGSAFGLRAPYLIPPTPIGVSVETHFTDVVRWYDFRSPWMPIEFVGDVRDFGVDADHAVESQLASHRIDHRQRTRRDHRRKHANGLAHSPDAR